MKTINPKLCKRLNDEGYLDNIETEYGYEYDNETNNYDITYYLPFNKNIICKALTSEEAIEFLKKYAKEQNFKIETNDYMNLWSIYGQITPIFRKETLLESIEKFLEYLLDNDLLGKQ